MASVEQLTQNLRAILDEGVNAGVLSRAEADRRLRAAGVEPAQAATDVTINLRVTGDVRQLRGNATQVAQAVEAALGNDARRVGVSIVRGSTTVQV